MPKLGKREDWHEPKATEEREGWPIRRPHPEFRGAFWTAVASDARRRSGHGKRTAEAPTSRRGVVGESGGSAGRLTRNREDANRPRTIAEPLKNNGIHAETR